MPTVTRERFGVTLQSALERMAFVLAEPSDVSAGEALTHTGHHSTIEIVGASGSTWLGVSASAGFVRELASGMMGLEPDDVDPDEHGEPTVCELANVFGGELLLALGGDSQPMRLGLPQAIGDTEVGDRVDRATAGEDGWVVVLRSDSGWLVVYSHR